MASVKSPNCVTLPVNVPICRVLSGSHSLPKESAIQKILEGNTKLREVWHWDTVARKALNPDTFAMIFLIVKFSFHSPLGEKESMLTPAYNQPSCRRLQNHTAECCNMEPNHTGGADHAVCLVLQITRTARCIRSSSRFHFSAGRRCPIILFVEREILFTAAPCCVLTEDNIRFRSVSVVLPCIAKVPLLNPSE